MCAPAVRKRFLLIRLFNNQCVCFQEEDRAKNCQGFQFVSEEPNSWHHVAAAWNCFTGVSHSAAGHTQREHWTKLFLKRKQIDARTSLKLRRPKRGCRFSTWLIVRVMHGRAALSCFICYSELVPQLSSTNPAYNRSVQVALWQIRPLYPTVSPTLLIIA